MLSRERTSGVPKRLGDARGRAVCGDNVNEGGGEGEGERDSGGSVAFDSSSENASVPNASSAANSSVSSGESSASRSSPPRHQK